MPEEFERATTAYDEIVARRDAKAALAEQDDLMVTLTGEDARYTEEITSGWRVVLWTEAGVLSLMGIAGILANIIVGPFAALIYALFWSYSVKAAEELAASPGGAGNMYRHRRIRLTDEWKKQAEERRQVTEAILEHENPQELLENLADPGYLRTLKEALYQDEHGWVMAD